jgi:PIN domain nuclease of toxin-antitoxin system
MKRFWHVHLILDTVTFIWATISPDRISRAAMTALRRENAVRELSVISVCEIAIKQSRGKLTLTQDDVTKGAADLRLRILPYTADHAFRLFDLPLHHADPFDRQIIAQALVERVRVVTPDENFRLYKGLDVIW